MPTDASSPTQPATVDVSATLGQQPIATASSSPTNLPYQPLLVATSYKTEAEAASTCLFERRRLLQVATQDLFIRLIVPSRAIEDVIPLPNIPSSNVASGASGKITAFVRKLTSFAVTTPTRFPANTTTGRAVGISRRRRRLRGFTLLESKSPPSPGLTPLPTELPTPPPSGATYRSSSSSWGGMSALCSVGV
ncbi:expressed unknown protein [Seminavis robusta]|uniref:Uncharacterized protein n=1 Tax=Seminavis robusta TaxID=568900 RepID=A0A9N8DE04_9STRA|nr:expressed unknown protein [Seminavis robusta]|eukprot:Sro95_g049420.1 n/a (193) ;mRNA; f:116805-117383